MSDTRKTRILVVDDQPLLRNGIAAVIKKKKTCYFVGCTANNQEAIELFREQRPDIALMDLRMLELVELMQSQAFTKSFETLALSRLRPRPSDVLSRVTAGTSDRVVAAQLAMTETTVKAHMKNILLKLDASDRTHAVTIAMHREFLGV